MPAPNPATLDDAQNLIHVHEGIVIGHVRCENENQGCRGPVVRVVDPYELEIHDETIEIDICEGHLQDRYDDI